MQPLVLPPLAFLPRHRLTDNARAGFLFRRDRLFRSCTAQEQRLLIALADAFDADEAPSRAPGLIAWLTAAQDEFPSDVLFGVVHFLRVLPVQGALRESGLGSPLREHLFEKALVCAEDTRIPASRRHAALKRAALWSWELTGEGGGRDGVRLHGLWAWRIVLGLLDEDPAAGLAVFDEHWTGDVAPKLMSPLDLHGEPDLAGRLALKLRPHRPGPAASLMADALSDGALRLSRERNQGPTPETLQRSVDAAGAILADWVLADGLLEPQVAVAAILKLFEFGDPSSDHWRRLPGRVMALLQEDFPERRRLEAGALMSVILYASPGDPLAVRATGMLDAMAAGFLKDIDQVSFGGASQLTIFLDDTVGVLEDTVVSRRNRRVPLPRDHAVLTMMDARLDELMSARVASRPALALSYRVALARTAPHEVLVRKHHRLLREEFEMLARAFPKEAGVALHRVITYCGYSQLHDQAYRHDLCAESFELLIPLLAAISPEDAAFARQGIGWNIRDHGYDHGDE
ncbi:hypothetical protein ACQ86G_19520 [Roseateles chitinivorans]|uniref:hypothetical protein n=1 Tax=Roseateles chitinivorans TaxID=2917965 RepID=UPI003D666BEC